MKNYKIVQELVDQEWERFYMSQVPVPMAIYDFQRRHMELPSEQVFFDLALYPLVAGCLLEEPLLEALQYDSEKETT